MMTYRHNDMSRLIVLALVLAAGLLAGCARDVPEIKEEKSEISVTTNLTPMRMRANTIDSNSELQGYDIKIDAYYNGTDTKYIDGTKLHYDTDHEPSPAWVFWDGSAQLHYYWPFDGSVVAGGSTTASTLDFIGYCPYDKPDYITSGPSYAAGNISFTATMPTTEVDEVTYMANQASLNEYLVAKSANQTYAVQEEYGGVPLQFKHPFAYIKFSLSEATTEYTMMEDYIIISGMGKQ